MKKIFVLLLAGLCFVPFADAAAKLQPGFSFGFKAGFHISDFSGRDVDSGFRSDTGLAAGGLIAYRLSNVLAVQAEALFTQKGARIFTKLEGVLFNEWITLKYIEIPLLLKVFPPLDSSIRPVFYAGPYVAFKYSFKDKWELGGQGSTEDIPSFRERELGFAGGFGVDFPVGKSMRTSAEIRYTRGLSTLSKNSEEKGYNAVFSILVQLAFGK